MSIYGELDTSNECLKRVLSQVLSEWSEGKTRYRKEDIARAEKYLREISKSSKAIRAVLNDFNGIVLSQSGGTIKPLANKKNKNYESR